MYVWSGEGEEWGMCWSGLRRMGGGGGDGEGDPYRCSSKGS